MVLDQDVALGDDRHEHAAERPFGHLHRQRTLSTMRAASAATTTGSS
jgi:hypothetical protein